MYVCYLGNLFRIKSKICPFNVLVNCTENCEYEQKLCPSGKVLSFVFDSRPHGNRGALFSGRAT